MRIFTALCATALLVVSGCSKNDSNPVDQGVVQSSPVLITVLRNPIKNTSDPNAVKTSDQIELINTKAKAAWAVPFATLPGTNSGKVTSWTYYSGSLRETFTLTRNEDGSSAWNLIFLGSVGTVSYSNWVYASGTNGADAKSAAWDVYVDNLTLSQDNVVFSTDAGGTITASYQFFRGSPTSTKTTVVSKPDGSGSSEFDHHFSLTTFGAAYTSQWNADGSGTWKTYKSDGSILLTGSWTK